MKGEREPTKEQKQEFWEQCGLSILYPSAESLIWIDSANRVVPTSGAESPPIDLNNLFKYAVLKLYKYDVVLVCKGERECEASIWESPNGKQITYAESSDPALALFWAIYKAFGGVDV